MRIDTLWKRLYRAAAEMIRAEPWIFMDDSQLLALKTPEMAEPLYVNVLGNSGMTYGLVFYPGSEGLNDYHMLRAADELGIENFLLFQQNCFVMYLGSENDIPQDQAKYFRKYSGMSAQGDSLPYFLKLHPGYYPWTPNKEDAAVLLGYLELLCDCWGEVEVGDGWGIDMDGKICRMDKTEAGWQCSFAKAPFSGYYADIPALPAEYIRDAGESGPSGTDYEADIFYVHAYVHDKEYEYPVNSAIILVCDCDEGMAIGMNMTVPEDEVLEVFQHTVLSAIGEYGVPDTLYVRSVLFRDALAQIGRELDIRIEVSRDMELLDSLEKQIDTVSTMFPDTLV